jgi:hypothetical protein
MNRRDFLKSFGLKNATPFLNPHMHHFDISILSSPATKTALHDLPASIRPTPNPSRSTRNTPQSR